MGAAYSLLWRRTCPKADDFSSGISFGDSQRQIWICTGMYEKTMAVFVRATLGADGSVSFPELDCRISLDLFSYKYDTLACGSMDVYSVPIDWSRGRVGPFVLASEMFGNA